MWYVLTSNPPLKPRQTTRLRQTHLRQNRELQDVLQREGADAAGETRGEERFEKGEKN